MALKDLLPDNYSQSVQVMGLQEAIDSYAEKIKEDKNDFFDQLRVKTATWGLTAWEKSLGIKTDISASYEFRRERICAKLRGTGTTTKAMIEQTAAAYSGGEVEIIEYPEANRFAVKFVGTLGVPENMADLTLTIEEIKPAHLSYNFEYVYNPNSRLSKFTHAQLSARTYYQLRNEAII